MSMGGRLFLPSSTPRRARSVFPTASSRPIAERVTNPRMVIVFVLLGFISRVWHTVRSVGSRLFSALVILPSDVDVWLGGVI